MRTVPKKAQGLMISLNHFEFEVSGIRPQHPYPLEQIDSMKVTELKKELQVLVEGGLRTGNKEQLAKRLRCLYLWTLGLAWGKLARREPPGDARTIFLEDAYDVLRQAKGEAFDKHTKNLISRAMKVNGSLPDSQRPDYRKLKRKPKDRNPLCSSKMIAAKGKQTRAALKQLDGNVTAVRSPTQPCGAIYLLSHDGSEKVLVCNGSWTGDAVTLGREALAPGDLTVSSKQLSIVPYPIVTIKNIGRNPIYVNDAAVTRGERVTIAVGSMIRLNVASETFWTLVQESMKHVPVVAENQRVAPYRDSGGPLPFLAPQDMKVGQLKDVCRARCLKVGGTKLELRQRLREYEVRALPGMNVPQLKAACRARKLPVGGKKLELQERLRTSFQLPTSVVNIQSIEATREATRNRLAGSTLSDLKKETVTQLKKMCRSLDLKVGGNKAVLIERLQRFQARTVRQLSVCSVCLEEDLLPGQQVSCSSGVHHYCLPDRCLDEMVENLLLATKIDGAIPCTAGSHCQIEASVLEEFLQREMLVKWVAKKATVATLTRKVDTNFQAMMHALTPCCPNCSTAVLLPFEGGACFSLSCGCGTHICGFCGKLDAHGGESHDHVAECQQNPYAPNIWGLNDPATWLISDRNWKVRQLSEQWKQVPNSSRHKVMQKLKQQFESDQDTLDLLTMFSV